MNLVIAFGGTALIFLAALAVLIRALRRRQR